MASAFPLSIGAALAAWAIAAALFRNVTKGAAAALVFIIACYTYTPVATWFYNATFFPPLYFWGPVTLGLCILAGLKWKWHKPLNVLSIALVVTSVSSILLGYRRIEADESRLAKGGRQSISQTAARPDIFYLILDGYGRQDQLKRVMHFDDTGFIDELTKRGFYVAAASHSNYVQTELSLASSLNMDLIPKLIPQMPTDDDRGPLDELASHNAVAGYLKSLGYEYIAITSGFPSLQFNAADLRLGNPHKLSLLESTIVAMTPISLNQTIDESEYSERRELLAAAFSNMETVGTAPSVVPRFVFVHVLAPHPPFVVNADGSFAPKRSKGAFGYWDGSDFYQFGNTPEQYRDGYVKQLQWVNTQTLAVVDSLLANAKSRPIILVQGDHGSKLGLNQGSLAKTDIPECMSNLMAYEVPDDVKAKLYPSITPVNSFRILLSTLFGANLPNLEDESWYSTFRHPYHFMSVTERLGVRHGQ